MTAEDLKKSILQQAIQGKLVPQCPDDEPASFLLDRIRAEKARLVDEGKIKHDKNESIIYRNPHGQYIERIGKTETDITDQIPFEIPDSWEWCRIGDIFTHNNGKQLNKSNKSGVMMDYITTSNLYWDGFRLDNLKQMPFEASEIERCQAVKGDLLVCEGGDIGRSCIWEYDYPIMLQNHIHRLRGVIDVKTKYFYYIFYLYNLMGIIGGKGIGIQGFSSKALHNTFIPLPPHTEQERIVAKIEELMPMVEEYGKVHSRLDELNSSLGDNLRKSVLQYAIQGKLVSQNPAEEPASVLLDRIRAEKARLVAEGKIKRDKNVSVIYRNLEGQFIERIGKTDTDISDKIPFEIPDSWEWVRGKSVFNAMESTKPSGEYFTYIDIDAVNNSSNKIQRPKTLSSEKAPSRATRKLHEGDILFSMVRPYLRNIALVEDKYKNAIASTGFYVVSGTKFYDAKFLLYLLLSPYVVDGLNQFMKGENSPSINNSHIENYLYPLPPIEEQKRIVERIEQILSLYK